MPYAFITWIDLRNALLQRLQDAAGIFTTQAEAAVYLTEALRVLNAQTLKPGTVDYKFDFNPGDGWKSLDVMGSPRRRTVTDTSVETQIEYMLLEPPTGGTWTGTNQFTIEEIAQALQFRRDEILLMTAATTLRITQTAPTNSQRANLPDTSLDLKRVRWIPLPQSGVDPYALQREDVVTVNAFKAQGPIETGSPDSWMITANEPLAFDVSQPPNVPGTWDLLTIPAGVAFNPPNTAVLGLPDDWCWLAMYGALADLLSNSPEAADPFRAKYCRSRYEQGLKAMMNMPWLLDASVDKLPVDTPSVREMDAFAQNWENTYTDPTIVVGGIDYIALAPWNPATVPPATDVIVSSVLTVVGNAPIPAADGAFVQLSQDSVDQVLNYAQHLAMFKTGGEDFAATFPLLKEFEQYCAAQNRRYDALGILRLDMNQQGNRIDDLDPRFGVKRG